MKRTEFIEKSLIKTTLLLFITVFALSCASGKKEINDGDKIVMEKSILLDKIRPYTRLNLKTSPLFWATNLTPDMKAKLATITMYASKAAA